MRFSIYVLRDDEDFAIFDRNMGDPPVGEAHEYDCAGVFECEDPGAQIYRTATQDRSVLGLVDEWRLEAQSILCGDFTDKDSGNTAKITKLWPCELPDIEDLHTRLWDLEKRPGVTASQISGTRTMLNRYSEFTPSDIEERIEQLERIAYKAEEETDKGQGRQE